MEEKIKQIRYNAETDRLEIDVLTGRATAQEAIQHLQQFDIIPATAELSTASVVLTETGKEHRLKEALEAVTDLYDYCIIDTPPELGILTSNALTACNGVIIPAFADADSLEGIQQLYGSIQTIKKYCNPAIEAYGIVITKYNQRTTLAKDMRENIENLAAVLGIPLYKTVIRENVAIQEAKAVHQTIYAYDRRSKGANDYIHLCQEVMKQVEKRK